MKSYLSQVADFHRAFKVSQPEPIIPTFFPATNSLRIELIREELRELQSGITANDRIEVLDALCDTQYVLSGSVLAWGLRSLFENIKITTEQRPIPDMERHLVMMFGLLPQMEVAADMEFGGQVLTHLQLLQSRLSRLVFHFSFENFSGAFAEVHRSNMSKLWDMNEVDKAVADGSHRIRDFEWTEGKMAICKRADGKIIKSPSYSPANLRKYV